MHEEYKNSQRQRRPAAGESRRPPWKAAPRAQVEPRPYPLRTEAPRLRAIGGCSRKRSRSRRGALGLAPEDGWPPSRGRPAAGPVRYAGRRDAPTAMARPDELVDHAIVGRRGDDKRPQSFDSFIHAFKGCAASCPSGLAAGAGGERDDDEPLDERAPWTDRYPWRSAWTRCPPSRCRAPAPPRGLPPGGGSPCGDAPVEDISEEAPAARRPASRRTDEPAAQRRLR